MPKKLGSSFFSNRKLITLLFGTPLLVALSLSVLSLFFAKALIISGLSPILIYAGNICGILAVIGILYTYARIYSKGRSALTHLLPKMLTLTLAILFLEATVALNTYTMGNLITMHLLSLFSSAVMLQFITAGILIVALTLTTIHLITHLINNIREKNNILHEEVVLLKQAKHTACASAGELVDNVDQHNKKVDEYNQQLITDSSEHQRHCQTLSAAARFLDQVITDEYIDEEEAIKQIQLTVEFEELLSPVQSPQKGG